MADRTCCFAVNRVVFISTASPLICAANRGNKVVAGAGRDTSCGKEYPAHLPDGDWALVVSR